MATDTADSETKSAYEYQFRKDYKEDWDIHQKYAQTFDPLEAMLLGQVYDSVSNSVDGSKITDSYAATLAIERAARVMGKLPDGMTEAVAKADQGKAAFMDILRQKWIYPNANSQHNFDTKLRLWQLYSSVYGYMPMFYDWNVSTTGYVGPDCWLWNPRNLVPQQGRTSIADMEYVTALTWVSRKFLQDKLDNESEGDGWNRDALKELVELAGNEITDVDPQKNTLTERSRTPQGVKKGICLATRYEAGDDGRWCTFAPDHSYVQVREIENPHKNGRIPFVIKYSQPLFDSFYGLGDFQRAKPLQFARDGLTNFYFKGIKMNLIPPIVANANGVLKHTLDYREGAVMLETIPNSIRRLETSNAGLATYQAAQSNLTGSLLSLFGSQNASLPGAEALNPSQGKTPAAIGLYSDKEATRDGQERMYLEGAIEQLTDGFFSLVANIGTEDIPINLFEQDIQEIAKSGLGDVQEIFQSFQPNATETAGVLQIKPDSLKGIEYRFNIASGSTAKLNKDAQRQELENMMGNIAKFQNQFKDDPSISVNWGAIMKAYEGLTEVPGASEFVTLKSPEEVAQAQAQAAQAAAQASQTPPKAPSETLNYKDAPEDVKRQIEEQAGLQPSQGMSPAATQQALQHSQIIASHNQTQQADASHQLATAQAVSQEQQAGQQAAQQAQAANQPPDPVFAGGGAYNDPLIAAAAEHLSK